MQPLFHAVLAILPLMYGAASAPNPDTLGAGSMRPAPAGQDARDPLALMPANGLGTNRGTRTSGDRGSGGPPT